MKNNQFCTPAKLNNMLSQLRKKKKIKTFLKKTNKNSGTIKKNLKKKKNITNTETNTTHTLLKNEINIFKLFTLIKQEIKKIKKSKSVK